MALSIRRVRPGDEAALAAIQTGSWRAAFSHILRPEELARRTETGRVEAMYASLLNDERGHGYILTLDDQPQAMAWWDAARDERFSGMAELICIHSLPAHWRSGCGSALMDRVVEDVRAAGYDRMMLWVFRENARARAFYRAKGFIETDVTKNALGAEEICLIKDLAE